MINVKPLDMVTVTEGCFAMKSANGGEFSVIKNNVSSGWTVHARKYNKVIRGVDMGELIENLNSEWTQTVKSLFNENDEVKPLVMRQNGKGYIILSSADGNDRFTAIGTGKIALYDLDNVKSIDHQLKTADDIIAFAQNIWKERVLNYVES